MLINLIFLYFLLAVANFFLRDFISLFYYNFNFLEILFFNIVLLVVIRIISLSFSTLVSSNSSEISKLSILLINSSLFKCRSNSLANNFQSAFLKLY